MKFILNLPLRKVQLLTSFLKSCCTLYFQQRLLWWCLLLHFLWCERYGQGVGGTRKRGSYCCGWWEGPVPDVENNRWSHHVRSNQCCGSWKLHIGYDSSDLVDCSWCWGLRCHYSCSQLLFERHGVQLDVNSCYSFIKPQQRNPSYDLDSYKIEDMVDLYKSNISTQFFHFFMDGPAAKKSVCMTAMENTSINAGEMIDSLTLQCSTTKLVKLAPARNL